MSNVCASIGIRSQVCCEGYVQAAEGYRLGQLNQTTKDPLSGQPIPPASNPDKLWNYEVGEKSTLFEGRLTLNTALYYVDWSDIQLEQRTLANEGQASRSSMPQRSGPSLTSPGREALQIAQCSPLEISVSHISRRGDHTLRRSLAASSRRLTTPANR
jgi:hypothetical protein